MATDTPEDLDALVANEMSAEEIERALRDHGTGVLSLARAGESYAIPVSYGYDGERCYFVFVGYHEPSTKAEFAETTERATLTVYDAPGIDEWHSVILRGPLRKLTTAEDWDAANEAIEANAWYPSLFRNADPRGNVDLWALDPEEATGYTSR
ncbi:MAG: pyridoxamine 5'-phosphate oxidase family protein [Halobaculum sp.]